MAWLDFLGADGLGSILADDMGLGKTVQVLMHILGARQRKQLDAPALVMAPTGLAGNRQSEALPKLRQACRDPRLVKLAGARNVKTPTRLDTPLELLDTLLGEGRRILLFSQFTEMLG